MKNYGFKIIRGLFNLQEINLLRSEADRIAQSEKSTCVRHLRRKSQLFEKLSAQHKLLNLFSGKLVPVRSILFDKTPDENWPVAWHQDLTIAVQDKREVPGYSLWSMKEGVVHVQPPVQLLKKMVTVRIHLDDTPDSNGALRVIPKSNAYGKIPAKEIASYINDSEVTCECSAGDVLLMSPLILHASRKSNNPAKRRIIHFEYAPYSSLDSKLSWYENKNSEPPLRLS